MKNILVTGGAGFIGSHFVELLAEKKIKSIVLDKLTYAGNLVNLSHISPDYYELIEGDIADRNLVRNLLSSKKVDGVVHLAAESHVDRSIQSATPFIQTNIVGSFVMLEESLRYWQATGQPNQFRFVQVSTDEVFGALGETGKFNEQTPYDPRSPYSASKASADQLGFSFFHTHHLPVIVTHCTNNYGPRQFPEKLIPFMIRQALSGRDIGVYGDGRNVRDWIHVQDHAYGIYLGLVKGSPGRRYCFGGNCEKRNIEIVKELCTLLDELIPRKDGQSYEKQIKFVTDRKGHDWRYAIDDSLAQKELGYVHKNSFQLGFNQTVRWYLENVNWMKTVLRSETL
ncbi:MAG: dTDP-glucose 4,6-dehydratase [Bdellovibrionales bacterium]|nr:dTDP-glucose 4,6-dehydratase [Bdellovibrionales bacterium]